MLHFSTPNKELTERLAQLEAHLGEEHPELLAVLPTYRAFDKVLYKMGLLDPSESLVTRITWWPLIGVLGTFSAGKSTFINHLLGQPLQKTGNQAVDDKFTVICYGATDTNRILPGAAVDADPRFPFYRMSDEIEKVAAGEGQRIDAYLQLKTSATESLKGKTLIDSPGFDADDNRRSILRLTDHILDISDLVLVFFDARHPEPGAMQDTLQHLVASSVKRPDSGKFLYILNQIDTAAREDNPEEVIAAWQRALAQGGLSSGRFYCIYNDAAAYPIEDDALRGRFERKRDEDMAEIMRRIEDVEIERSYRIVRSLETSANTLESDVVPKLDEALGLWQRLTMVGDAVALVAVAALFGLGFPDVPGALWQWLSGYPLGLPVGAAAAVAVLFGGHFLVRDVAARIVGARLPDRFGPLGLNIKRAFQRNTRFFRSLFRSNPVGWGRAARKHVDAVRGETARHVQRLNDSYTNPSGRPSGQVVAEPAPAVLEEAQPESVAVDDIDEKSEETEKPAA